MFSSDQDLEKRAQEAIDAYFAQNCIIPSPWTDSAKKKPFQLPQTPRTPGLADSPMIFVQRKSASPAAKSKTPMKDAVCQTTLTLPIEYDLQKVLADFYTFTGRETCESGDVSSQDMMSMSSLRRKLFFHGAENTAPSPVKPNKSTGPDGMDFDISPPVSPVKLQTPQQPRRPSPMQTPGSAQFSSSPISGPRCAKSLTPFLRRCSSGPELMASPGFSPIGSDNPEIKGVRGLHSSQSMTPMQAIPSSVRGTRLFDSPGMSPIVQTTPGEAKGTRLFDSPGMSPIDQMTPGGVKGSRMFDSPGMSPIVQMDGSFVVTPLSEQRSRDKTGPASLNKVPIARELQPRESAAHSHDGRQPRESAVHSHDGRQEDEDGIHRMDIEQDKMEHLPEDNGLYFTANSKGAQYFTNIRDRDSNETEYSDEDSSCQDTPTQIHCISHMSQDTGYNTNSLQLTLDPGTHTSNQESVMSHTNQESVVSHTNLTQQFGSLPFTSHDTGVDLDDLSSFQTSSEDNITRDKRTQKQMIRHKATKGRQLNDREVIRRAKQILGKSISMDDSQLQMSVDTSPLKPRLINTVGAPTFPLVYQGQISAPSGDRSRHPSGPSGLLPSELAKHVLQKAGEDYNRYCGHVPSGADKQLYSKDILHPESSTDDYYLVTLDTDHPHGSRVTLDTDHPHGSRVSMSAEF